MLENELKNQAKKISAWIVGETKDSILKIILSNENEDSAYNAIFSIVGFGDGEKRDPNAIPIDRFAVKSVPPGKLSATRPAIGISELSFPPAIELTFTDKSGQHWVRHTNGRLILLKRKPIRHYALDKIDPPLQWIFPQALK